MATYTKETALYDTGAIATDIGAAGETASKYITTVDGGGIKVHPENNTTDYVQIDGDSLDIYSGGEQVASYGITSRIGKEGDAMIVLENGGIYSTGTGGGLLFSVNETETSELVEVAREKTYSGHALTARFSTDDAFRDAYNSMQSGTNYSVVMEVLYTYNSGSGGQVGRTDRVIPWFVKGTAVSNQTRTNTNLQYLYSCNAYGVLTLTVTERTSAVVSIDSVRIVLKARVNVNAPAFKFGTNLNTNVEYLDKPNSFSIGDGTMASANGMAMGKYNLRGSTKAFIIGNGEDDNSRSNAFSVDWDGNVNIAVNTTATSGDDFNLYTAISDLGWASNVIV